MLANSPKGRSTQTTDLSQGILVRTWKDGTNLLRSAVFLILDALLALLIALATLSNVSWPLPLIATLGLLSFLLLPFLFASAKAPFAQRNEARRELATMREALKPKLRVVDIRKSDDLNEKLADALIDTEYLHITVANQSNSRALDCRVLLTGMRPRQRTAPSAGTSQAYWAAYNYRGYEFVPYPVELTWADHASQQYPTSRSIAPQSQAQVDVLSFWSNRGLRIAFGSRAQRGRFQLPPTELIFSVQLYSSDSLPYCYVVRYMPRAPLKGDVKPFEILYEGADTPNLEDFRVDVLEQSE